MKNSNILLIAIITLFATAIVPSKTNAQNVTQCGDTISGEFSENGEIHEYALQGEANTLLYVIGKVESGYEDSLNISVNIYARNGRELVYTFLLDLIYASALLPENGLYTFTARGEGQFGGQYSLYISCVSPTGEVSSGTRYVQNAQCGTILESRFERDRESHFYFIDIENGSELDIKSDVLRGYEDSLNVAITIFSPNGRELAYTYLLDSVQATTFIPDSGTHMIEAEGSGSFGGQYAIYVRCTLPDGSVIEPGDAPPAPTPENDNTLGDDFTGFGFPGITAVDFSAGIEILLQAGQPQTAPIGRDIALYAYNASANEIATLSISRESGDISIGVAVINRDTNEIIFIGGMPSSNNLSVELTFPSDGTYAIGLFRLDTPERIGTSGAVQISIE